MDTYVCIGKTMVYIGFGTSCRYRRPLGVLECVPSATGDACVLDWKLHNEEKHYQSKARSSGDTPGFPGLMEPQKPPSLHPFLALHSVSTSSASGGALAYFIFCMMLPTDACHQRLPCRWSVLLGVHCWFLLAGVQAQIPP